MPETNNSFQEEQKNLNQHELAERWIRLLAKVIDKVLIILIGLLSVAIGSFDKSGNLMLILILIGLLGLLIYQAYLLTVSGQTIGKKMMQIKIVTVKTEENGGFETNFVVRAVVNYFIAAIVPLYGIIDILFIFSSERRCVHDRLAGTKVIKVYQEEQTNPVYIK
ncbi:MAG: RDD family protein [Ignavibacteriales bacterium]